MSDKGRTDNNRRTLGRIDLSESASIRLGLPQEEVRKILDDMLDEIASALTHGEDVKFSNFGKFKFMQKKERKARNPKTKESAIVSARNVVSFKPSISTIELAISPHLEK